MVLRSEAAPVSVLMLLVLMATVVLPLSVLRAEAATVLSVMVIF